MVEVTDADREAAEQWGTGPVYNMQHLAQAFARHRIAAEQRGKLEGARLAIEAAAGVCEASAKAMATGLDDISPEVAQDCAYDIRALSPAKIVGADLA